MKKIGVFDSGFGGLTILQSIRKVLPEYDYLYLGDAARAPYGTRSFEVIYEYTLQAVRYLQSQGCRLIIIACNTASAKALRTIQQHDIDPDQLRVLGVIRPTVEAVTTQSTQHIGVLATSGTVSSESYVIELHKLNPDLHIVQQACPMWVPLIENNEKDSPAMDYFVKKYVDKNLKDNSNEEVVMEKYKQFLDNIINYKYPPNTLDLILVDLKRMNKENKINRNKQNKSITLAPGTGTKDLGFKKSLRYYYDKNKDKTAKPFNQFTSPYGKLFSKCTTNE